MTVGLITTNYNTWELTSKCIENCMAFADDTIEQFVVIDDHSTQPFENQFKNIKLIRNSENLGLVKSLNKGLQAVDTDLVILFDSDAWPLENYILRTKQYFDEHPEVGIAAYTTENASGRPAIAYEPEPDAMSLILGQKLHGYYQKLFNNEPKQITVYTCAMVLRKEVIQQVGGFDESYDWLELDHDICMSAIRKGWKIGIIPVRAFHKGSGTPQKVSKRVIRFYQNRMKLLKKFNKYPAKYLLNTLIVSRLMVEYLSINTIGRFKMSNEIREDKSYSRSKLISMFLKGEV
ncbi:glycosyltransferase [Mucilaginibacter daejeonensis]|uniref:glycosyltransferase family 2 protein n=1 Tax=Mucilaginibacter daejeonensis TaxID=398049 RepID=UPI001D172C8E|nr:glycosyltransferase [Mucilaginibacter daejeonensis]UEG52658.1 glycosyltransferase [Mucilaginibacter daejeonensis]